jgi:hypothetical protein
MVLSSFLSEGGSGEGGQTKIVRNVVFSRHHRMYVSVFCSLVCGSSRASLFCLFVVLSLLFWNYGISFVSSFLFYTVSNTKKCHSAVLLFLLLMECRRITDHFCAPASSFLLFMYLVKGRCCKERHLPELLPLFSPVGALCFRFSFFVTSMYLHRQGNVMSSRPVYTLLNHVVEAATCVLLLHRLFLYLSLSLAFLLVSFSLRFGYLFDRDGFCAVAFLKSHLEL